MIKSNVRAILADPFYGKIFHWGRLISITSAAQLIIQMIGFVCGLLIIRYLNTAEYALYTIANAFLGVVILLSDGGIAGGVMSQGARHSYNREKLGVVMVTGLALRRQFMTAGLILIIPVLVLMLLNNGAGVVISGIIILSMVPIFYASLSDSILEIPLKLRQSIIPLQKNQVSANLGRLFLSGVSILALPFTSVALLATGIPRIWANYFLKKKSEEFADFNQHADPVVKKEILAVVKKVLPGAIYYSISGQITIFILSVFGTTTSVAQIGALGRLTMLLNVFNIVFSTLIVPRYAKLPDDGNLLVKRFLQIQLALLLFSFLVIISIGLFSDQFLFILGRNYAGLNQEIVMMTVNGCVGLMSGLTYSISLARGWVLPPAINIAGNIITQVLLILVLDLSVVKNVLLFSIINSLAAFLMLIIYFFIRAKKTVRAKA